MSVNLGTAYAEIILKTDKFNAAIKSTSQELTGFQANADKVASGFTKTGAALTAAVTTPIVGLGAATVKTTMTFDQSMSKVQALSGATAEEFDKLRASAMEMGSKTAFTASEAADAFSYMALAGWDTTQMLDGIQGVLDLAAASQMDLAEASDIVTDYLTAFGLEAAEAGRMANEMSYAQANSNTTTRQLGDAFGNCAANMHTAGQTMETTTALLESMANQGLKGSEAGTALAAVVRDITQKMEDGAIAIGDTAVQVQDQEGNFRDLVDIMADVEKATQGMGSAQKSAALMQTFTARSIKAVSMTLTEGTDKIYGYRDALNSADGAASDMADTMLNNLNGQMTLLKSAVEGLMIQVGDIITPYISQLVDKIQKLIQWLSSLTQEEKEQVVRIAAIAAAIGPLLLTVGALIKSISSITGAIKGFVTFIIANPILAGVAAAVGLITVAVYKCVSAYNEWRESIRAVSEENKKIKEESDAYVESMNQQVEANKQLVASLEMQYADQQALIDELGTIVDENGRVKEGYEERAQVISEQLAEAFGVEIEYQNGVIQKYDEVMAKIDELIEKKKAEALLEAGKERYAEELSKESELITNAKNATNEYNNEIGNINASRDRLTSTRDKMIDALQNPFIAALPSATAFQFGVASASDAIADLDAKEANLKNTMDTANEAWTSHETFMRTYQGLQTAVIDSTKNLELAETQYINQTKTNAEATIAQLKQQALAAQQEYDTIAEAYASGDMKVSDATLKKAEEAKKAAMDAYQEALRMSTEEGENITSGYSEGIDKSLDAVGEQAEKMAKTAHERVQTYNDSHSPSRLYDTEGKNVADGYTQGIRNNFPKAVQELTTNLTKMLTDVKSWSVNMVNAATDMARKFVNDTIQKIRELPTGILNLISSIPGRISNLVSAFSSAGQGIMNGLWNGMKTVWNSISNWFNDVLSKITNFVSSIRAKMSEANSASAGSHADGLSYVPYNGYRATLHEGERVLTKNEAQNMGTGVGYSFTFNSPKAIDPYEANKLFKSTVRQMQEGFA